MNLWRLHVRPSAEEGADLVEVCLRKGIVGIGWRVDKTPETKDDYWRAGEKKYGGKGWSSAANAVLYRMEVDDLVWIRTLSGIYHIGRITSDWRYMADPRCTRADLFNVRKAELYEAGTRVAGKVINCFRPSATVQAIYNDTALLFSTLLFNRLSGREQYPVAGPKEKIDIFDLLSDVELEDVVGLYLQLENDYAVVPSSRQTKGDTLFYEYELLSRRDGTQAFVQVKSGNVKIDVSAYAQFGRKIYLFSPAGYYGKKPQNAIPLDRDALEGFITKGVSALPAPIQVWVNYWKEARQ